MPPGGFRHEIRQHDMAHACNAENNGKRCMSHDNLHHIWDMFHEHVCGEHVAENLKNCPSRVHIHNELGDAV